MTDFERILKHVMDFDVPPESAPAKSIDYLVQESYIVEKEIRKFRITPEGALLYAEIFLRLTEKK